MLVNQLLCVALWSNEREPYTEIQKITQTCRNVSWSSSPEHVPACLPVYWLPPHLPYRETTSFPCCTWLGSSFFIEYKHPIWINNHTSRETKCCVKYVNTLRSFVKQVYCSKGKSTRTKHLLLFIFLYFLLQYWKSTREIIFVGNKMYFSNYFIYYKLFYG